MCVCLWCVYVCMCVSVYVCVWCVSVRQQFITQSGLRDTRRRSESAMIKYHVRAIYMYKAYCISANYHWLCFKAGIHLLVHLGQSFLSPTEQGTRLLQIWDLIFPLSQEQGYFKFGI